MKRKSILSAALLSLGAGAAAAQSSVVLGGILDSAVRYVHNQGGGSIKSLVSGSNQTSRVYFRGDEDLGGGLSAGFWLESGLAADTGTSTGGTQFFDRRATLSLSSRGFGELRLGRDYVPNYAIWVRHDPFSHVGVAGSNNFSVSSQQGPIRSAFGTGPNTTVRSSNAVEFLLPAGLGGLEGGLMVAAGEGRNRSERPGQTDRWPHRLAERQLRRARQPGDHLQRSHRVRQVQGHAAGRERDRRPGAAECRAAQV